MPGPCFIRYYDVGANETYQVEANVDDAVKAGQAGRVVDRNPLLSWNGKPYPIRSCDADIRHAQREAELRARLQPEDVTR